jgi:hypothetical protein
MRSPKEVRSFRLEGPTLDMLRGSARRHGITENAIVEGVLKRYLLVDPIMRSFDYIGIGKETFTSVLGMTNVDGLELVGTERGKRAYSLARELFESNDLRLGFPQFVSDILGKEARWFRTEGIFARPERTTLQHSYGNRWSAFLKAYLSSAYEATSHSKLEMASAADYVTIRFPETTFE